MSWFMVDVEADGPYPPRYSMVSFGAVCVENTNIKYYAQLHPISNEYLPEALNVGGYTREETLTFANPQRVMLDFEMWIRNNAGSSRPMFISDNNGFDWQFMNYYLWEYTSNNPFGHSSTNLGSLYKGMVKDAFKSFKHLRKTKHTHHPVDDCLGNIEALLEMRKMGLRL